MVGLFLTRFKIRHYSKNLTNESSTLFIGRPLIHLESVVSTNGYLLDLTTKSTPSEGTAVVADIQTGGKGQFGSSWHSEPGTNLLFSVLLQPTFLPPVDQFMLSRVAALAVHGALADDFPGLVIKWPNDIWLEGRKVSGILIENVLSGMHFRHSVIGIGLNVNQTVFPPHLPLAGSLAAVAGHPLPLEPLLGRIFQHLEHQYLRLRRGDLDGLCADYEWSLHQLDVLARYAHPGEAPFDGILRGVNREGFALVEHAGTGIVRPYNLKEIRFL